jgi:hypothetical protein
MPLYWTIDSKGELVTVVAEGDVTRADADAYLDAMEGAGVLGYRKLFDGMAGTLVMDGEDLLAIGVRLRSFHRSPVGALAMVLPDDRLEPVARILGILASADRPIRLFKNLPSAQRWIERLAPGPAG